MAETQHLIDVIIRSWYHQNINHALSDHIENQIASD